MEKLGRYPSYVSLGCRASGCLYLGFLKVAVKQEHHIILPGLLFRDSSFEHSSCLNFLLPSSSTSSTGYFLCPWKSLACAMYTPGLSDIAVGSRWTKILPVSLGACAHVQV